MMILNKKRIIKAFFYPITYLIAFIDYCWPKNENLIIFGSDLGQHATGSPKALFEFIEKKNTEYETIFYNPSNESMNLYERILYVLKFIPSFFRAKFLVSSHPPYDFFPFYYWSRKKIFINTWHGSGFKAMFFADINEKENNLKEISRLNKKTSIFLISSDFDASLMHKSFQLALDKFQITGHPRNDVLFSKDHTIGKFLDFIPNNAHIILYCPTYRRDSNTTFFPFEDLDWNDLSSFLERNNSIILIRGHIYNQLDKFNNFFSERIIDFGYNVCSDINSILSDVDVIITDYSSIYVDYLLLNKPCIFIPYDLEDYIKNRGLLIDDYDFWAPGEKVLTYSEFINALGNIINGYDHYEKKREEICNQFHYYNDGKSCERVFELIKKFNK